MLKIYSSNVYFMKIHFNTFLLIHSLLHKSKKGKKNYELFDFNLFFLFSQLINEHFPNILV